MENKIGRLRYASLGIHESTTPRSQSGRQLLDFLLTASRQPVRGSEEWVRLVGLARAAAAYGHCSAARQLWEAAAAWPELLGFCALQGDFDALRNYCLSVRLAVGLTG